MTAWLALTPASAANGCLRFLPGSHTKQARGGRHVPTGLADLGVPAPRLLFPSHAARQPPPTQSAACLQFPLAGRARDRPPGLQLPHVDTHDEDNLLLKGQTILELAGVEGEHVPLLPGQATLHHIRLAHRSGPAAPDSQPRLGLALRYMAAHVQQSLDPRDSGAGSLLVFVDSGGRCSGAGYAGRTLVGSGLVRGGARIADWGTARPAQPCFL